MRAMAGTGELLRLALLRSRVMLAAWVLALGAAGAPTASSYVSLYATEASRREVVATLGRTPATLALYGRIHADSVGGLVALAARRRRARARGADERPARRAPHARGGGDRPRGA